MSGGHARRLHSKRPMMMHDSAMGGLDVRLLIYARVERRAFDFIGYLMKHMEHINILVVLPADSDMISFLILKI